MARLPGWKSAYDLLPGKRLTHYARWSPWGLLAVESVARMSAATSGTVRVRPRISLRSSGLRSRWRTMPS